MNGCTARDWFLGETWKMHLPSDGDLCELIRKVGRSCYLCATDVARAYCKLPLDPGDLPLICFQTQMGSLSLPGHHQLRHHGVEEGGLYPISHIILSEEFRKDLKWFNSFLPRTDALKK